MIAIRVIVEKRILIVTWRLRYCGNGHEIFLIWSMALQGVADIYDESQRYDNYHEIAALAAIQQPALIVFVRDP